MAQSKFPEHIMKVLRQREELDSNDTHLDERLNNLSPHQAFDEVMTWHLGPGWASQALKWAEQCGIKFEA